MPTWSRPHRSRRAARAARRTTCPPLEGADTQPADKPRVGDATAGLNRPEEVAGAPDLSAGGETPVVPQVSTGGPDAPTREAGVPAVADPAQPAPPTVPQTGSGFGMTPPADEDAPDVASLEESERAVAASPAAGASPEDETVPEVVTDPGAAPQDQPDRGAVAGADGTPAMPVGAPAATAPATGDETAAPDASAPRIAALPQAGEEPDAPDPSPAIGTPIKPLTERDEEQGATPGGPSPPGALRRALRQPGEPAADVDRVDRRRGLDRRRGAGGFPLSADFRGRSRPAGRGRADGAPPRGRVRGGVAGRSARRRFAAGCRGRAGGLA